ncbi:MAG: hypothetical protein ACXVA9_11100 [Bdellovibrionales bacterium]
MTLAPSFITKPLSILLLLAAGAAAHGKTFKNSYVSFEVPDNWTCLQEGVAWTCTPQNAVEAKEAVIVLAAKVAGPEDNLNNFLNFLRQPKKITTKVGTPMPSQVMSAAEQNLGGQRWIRAQHLGSEVQEYYTLYLATVKDSLAILVSFSSEKSRYTVYNPIFDKAIKTIRIVANDQLLFPKNKQGAASDIIGIQVPAGNGQNENMGPPPVGRNKTAKYIFPLGLLVILGAIGAYIFSTRRKKISHGKTPKPRTK